MTSILERPGLPTPAQETLDFVGDPTLTQLGASDYAANEDWGIVSFQITGATPPRRVILQRVAVDDWNLPRYDVEIGHRDPDSRWIVDTLIPYVAAKQLGEVLIEVHQLTWMPSVAADGVEVTLTRGVDGAVLVLIDTTIEPDGSDGRGGLRVRVNDADITECAPKNFMPFWGGPQ